MNPISNETNKIKVLLCQDHFERLVRGDTCISCPSKAENENVVMALSKLFSEEPDKFNQAVVTELRSIRSSQVQLDKFIIYLNEVITSDNGLIARVSKLEAENRNA